MKFAPTSYMGLITESSAVTFDQLGDIAAALQEQNDKDVVPIWGRPAVFKNYRNQRDMPGGWIPMLFQDDIAAPGAGGFHSDDHGQPYARILAQGDVSVTASHEAIETGIDLFGNRFAMPVHDDMMGTDDTIRMLIEACDPCEAQTYSRRGILLSDFLTPEYYDQTYTPGQAYTFLHKIAKPRGMLPGGYVSFVDSKGDWHQWTWFGSQPEVTTLGKLSVRNGSLREQLDRLAAENKHRIGLGLA